MKYISFGFLVIVFSACCQISGNKAEKAKLEILKTENDFVIFCQKQGIEAAFLKFSAEDARIIRGDEILIGKNEIKKLYSKARYKQAKLFWKPDFVEASLSGDLGYTYGKYVYSSVDSTGKPIEYKGIFHTVWKKQPDGNWRFVWD